MNKIYIYLLVLVSCGLLSSCDDENYQLYDASQINKIYFGVDTIKFVYGAREDKENDVIIPVKLIGMANLEQDGAFKVEIDNYESTAKNGTHYHMDEVQYFKKDSTMAHINIDFDKTALIKGISYSIILRIGTNDNYTSANMKKCVIIFGDTYIEQPEWWKPDRLGTYTQEKLIMFIQCFHKTQDIMPLIYEAIEKDWGKYLDTPSESNSRFQHLLTTYTYITYFKEHFYAPIYEYYKTTGDKLYEIPDPALLP